MSNSTPPENSFISLLQNFCLDKNKKEGRFLITFLLSFLLQFASTTKCLARGVPLYGIIVRRQTAKILPPVTFAKPHFALLVAAQLALGNTFNLNTRFRMTIRYYLKGNTKFKMTISFQLKLTRRTKKPPLFGNSARKPTPKTLPLAIFVRQEFLPHMVLQPV